MFNVSCIQLTSDNNVFSNLEKTTDLINNSIKKKSWLNYYSRKYFLIYTRS